MDLANEIKMIRQQAFLTQESFAEELSVSFSTVNRWESGKTQPSMRAMKKINEFCHSHKISFEELQTIWLDQTREVEL